MFKKVFRTIRGHLRARVSRAYRVGRFTITLPPGHMLDYFQELYGNYDRKLPAIARLVERKHGLMTVMDIGANIGDTAVAIRSACAAPIVCVEGNPRFLPLLGQNLKNVPETRVVNKFIGTPPTGTPCLLTVGGTARITRDNEESTSGSQSTQVSAEAFTTLDAVLAMNSDLPATRLLKIDTDGYDFRIILASADWLARAQPVLFFEFDPAFSPDGEKCEALEAMEALLKAGYSHFVLYDNFGDFLLSVSERVLEVFTDISVYLSQSRTRVGGIAYLDVCCFGSNDADLFHDVVRSERAGTFQVHLDP